MFIYREDMVKENSERKNIADIIVAKHRNGPTGLDSALFQEGTDQVREPGDGAGAAGMSKQMQGFAGFPAGKLATTPVPEPLLQRAPAARGQPGRAQGHLAPVLA